MVDEQPFYYYDSVLKKATPRQDWVARNEGPEYWQRETQTSIGTEQSFKANIEIAKQRFNQTGGVHVFQRMYGCEWDDETGVTKGYNQYGYDGEDFLALDLKTESWIASKQQAVLTKYKWERDRVYMEKMKYYFSQECPEWLKKYLNYRKNSLMRTDLPTVSFLQKTPSSPVTCHATGFYPDRAVLFWRKNGEEVYDGVDEGEILPNNDGTFQMSVDIDLSSVGIEDWTEYECLFQLFGKQDIVRRLEKPKTNTKYPNSNIFIRIIVTVVVLVVSAVTGFILYKKKNAMRLPSPDDNAEVSEQMILQA